MISVLPRAVKSDDNTICAVQAACRHDERGAGARRRIGCGGQRELDGKENPRAPTADDVREPQDLRVEITM